MVQKIGIVIICLKGLSLLLGLVYKMFTGSFHHHYDESVLAPKFIAQILSQVSLGQWTGKSTDGISWPLVFSLILRFSDVLLFHFWLVK